MLVYPQAVATILSEQIDLLLSNTLKILYVLTVVILFLKKSVLPLCLSTFYYFCGGYIRT